MALALGLTVRELLARIDARELTEWAAYYRVEPWGATRDNLHAGLITAAIVNANRDPKKGRAAKPGDFLLDPEADQDGADDTPDPAALYDKVRTWAVLNGAVKQGVANGSAS